MGGLGGVGLRCDDRSGCGFGIEVGGFWVWSRSKEVMGSN